MGTPCDDAKLELEFASARKNLFRVIVSFHHHDQLLISCLGIYLYQWLKCINFMLNCI